MLDAGTRYLHMVGPVTGVFGLAWRSILPPKAPDGCCGRGLRNMGRLVVAAGGGWLALRLGGDLSDVFLALAVALGALRDRPNAAAVAGGAWFRDRA